MGHPVGSFPSSHTHTFIEKALRLGAADLSRIEFDNACDGVQNRYLEHLFWQVWVPLGGVLGNLGGLLGPLGRLERPPEAPKIPQELPEWL